MSFVDPSGMSQQDPGAHACNGYKMDCGSSGGSPSDPGGENTVYVLDGGLQISSEMAGWLQGIGAANSYGSIPYLGFVADSDGNVYGYDLGGLDLGGQGVYNVSMSVDPLGAGNGSNGSPMLLYVNFFGPPSGEMGIALGAMGDYVNLFEWFDTSKPKSFFLQCFFREHGCCIRTEWNISECLGQQIQFFT